MSFFDGIRRATRTGLGRMMTARERQARRYVNSALLQLDDATLAKAGYDRESLERQRGAYYI